MTNDQILKEEKEKINAQLDKWVKNLFISLISTLIWTIGLDKGFIIILIWAFSLGFLIYSFFKCKNLGKQLSKLEGNDV